MRTKWMKMRSTLKEVRWFLCFRLLHCNGGSEWEETTHTRWGQLNSFVSRPSISSQNSTDIYTCADLVILWIHYEVAGWVISARSLEPALHAAPLEHVCKISGLQWMLKDSLRAQGELCFGILTTEEKNSFFGSRLCKKNKKPGDLIWCNLSGAFGCMKLLYHHQIWKLHDMAHWDA